MKLFSILINRDAHYIFKNIDKYNRYHFLLLKSCIKDLIWINQIKVRVIGFSTTGLKLILGGLYHGGKMANKNFDIDYSVGDNYFIGYGCLVFDSFGSGSGISKAGIGYHNLIDFNPSFIFMDIL